MKLITPCVLLSSSVVYAVPKIPEWHAPLPGEVRSPCPGINVLANHGILPRSGRNLTQQNVRDALGTYYNIDVSIADGLFRAAITGSGRPNATSFDFDMVDIRQHHAPLIEAIEMDASFSRADHYWGDNFSRNDTVWKQTKTFWTGDTIDVQKFGAAAAARFKTSQATNPYFYFPDPTLIGMAMSFMTNVLGDAEAGTVPTKYVDEWIVNERLPVHLGWRTSKKVTDGPSVQKLGNKIFEASGLSAGGKVKRGGFHVHAGVPF